MTYYQETAPGYEELHREEQLSKLRIICDNLDLSGTKKILDVGCGPLWSAEFFEAIVGIDPVFTGKNVIHAWAEKIPFPDNSFDIILCITAIHHFQLKQAISEMQRVATNEALFVVTVLKKSPKSEFIEQTLQSAFDTQKVIEELHDRIYFLRKNK